MKRFVVARFSLPAKTLEQTMELAKAENKSRSEVVSDALEKYYVMKRWEGLQKFCSRKAKRIGIHSEKDVDRLIHEFRR